MIDTSQLVPLIGQLKDGMADNQDKFMILSGLNSCIGELNGLLRTANQFFQKPENKAGRGGGNLPEDRS